MLEDFEALIKHIFRHRIWYGSGFLHALLISLVYYIGPYKIEQTEARANQQQVQKNIQKARRNEMERRVQDMQEIEDLVERLAATQNDDQMDSALQDNTSSKSHEGATEDDTTASSDHAESELDTSLKEEDPDLLTLLKNASDIAENIGNIENLQRALELAELMDIPLDDALEELKDLPLTLPDNIDELSDEELADSLKEFHDEARQTLADMLENQEQEKQGMSISLDQLGNLQNSGNSQKSSGGSANSVIGEAKEKLESSSRQFQGEFTGAGVGKLFARYNSEAIDKRPAELSQGQLKASGKHIGNQGQLADRIYVDTWYLIGPFDYEGRSMRDTPLPPEKLVDLEAMYEGKNGQFIQWDFYQTNDYPLVPPNSTGDATYYGFTELKFEEDTTTWVALGCDDDCKLWLNDELVWRSSNGFKPWYNHGGYRARKNDINAWNLTEHYRKLSFKQGNNRLLFRLDNGHRDLFFAMVVEKPHR